MEKKMKKVVKAPAKVTKKVVVKAPMKVVKKGKKAC